MKKMIRTTIALVAALATLGALVYVAVLYWDKVMELVCKVKNLLLCRKDSCCSTDDAPDYVDWEA